MAETLFNKIISTVAILSNFEHISSVLENKII